MLTSQVKTFIQVVRAGSMTKAARKEYRSTVAVMNQINSLEQSLGVKLLHRTNHGAQPTAAGQVFFDGAVDLQNQATALIAKTKERAQQAQEVIRIGTSLLRPSNQLVARWLHDRQSSNHFTLQLVPFVEDFQHGQDQLLTPQMDCVVTPYSVKSWSKHYQYLQLGTEECQIGVAKTNPLAKKDHLSWRDLSGQSLFLLKEGYSTVVDQIREEIQDHHRQIKIVDLEHLYDIDSFNQVVAAGGLVEIPAIWAHVDPEMVTLPMDWNYRLPYGLLYRKNARPAVKKFVASIKELDSQ